MTSFTDDFDRADSSDLGSGWVEVSGDWSIVSGELSPGSGGGTGVLRAATAAAGNDNFAQATITATTLGSQGVFCRGNTTFTSGYLWRNSGSAWNLFSVVDDTFTSIGGVSGAAAVGDVMKVQAVGSTIKGFVNGVEQVSVTDTDVATGTSVGFRCEGISGIRFDAFAGGDVVSEVSGTAAAVLGALAGTAAGVRTVAGAGAGQLGALAGAASGTRSVQGTAAGAGGALAGAATGVRTVVGTAAGVLGGLTATAASPAHITGTGSGTFGGLKATARGRVPGAREQGSWYGLLDIVREARQLAREDRERPPVACGDCGEPLRAGPRGELYCSFDGSIWEAGEAGGRLVGRVGAGVGL